MLFDQEKMLLLEIEKWSRVEEEVLRQKSTSTWVECGDATSKYFHAQWKIRCSHNGISFIYTERNIKFRDPRAIEAKFTGLMGARASNLPCLNVEVVKIGVCFTIQQQKELIKEVTHEEIIEPIFFIIGTLLPAVNTTTITFVSKVLPPTKVKDCRSIVCRTSLYKII